MTPIVWMLFAACQEPPEDPPSTPSLGTDPCVETELDPDGTEPTDEATLLDHLAATSLPTTIVWDRHPGAAAGEVSASFLLTVQGPAVRLERSGGGGSPLCPTDVAELRVPVQIEVQLDGGSVVTVFEGAVDASGPTVDDLVFGQVRSPAMLTTAWNDAGEAEFHHNTDLGSMSWEVVLGRSYLTDPSLIVAANGFLSDGSGYASAPWYAEGSWPRL